MWSRWNMMSPIRRPIEREGLLRAFILFLVMALVSACGRERIGTLQQEYSIRGRQDLQWANRACSSSRYVKPKADFLFLWDNSSSTNHLDEATKIALNKTVKLISSEYDFRILLAPLVTSNVGDTSVIKLVADNPKSLSSRHLLIPWDRAVEVLRTFPQFRGSKEAGLRRASELIKYGRNRGIFRRGSKMHVVLMSNQDDNSWHRMGYFQQSNRERNDYVTGRVGDLNRLKRDHSFQTLRLHSIVNACGEASNFVYREASRRLHNASGNYEGGAHPDSYNICGNSFLNIFDQINASVKKVLVAHQYNYWPVASSSAPAINPDEIEVFKDGARVSRSSRNGFTFENRVQRVNTRYAPDAGESFEGYVVQLHGSARVRYPQCLVVRTKSAKDCYRAIALPTRPEEATIQVRIGGRVINRVSPSHSRGWRLLKESGREKYYQSYDVRVSCPGSNRHISADVRSGYILRLEGLYYTNSDSVNVIFDPLSEI